MAQNTDFVRGFWIVTRWRNLAERRLAYLNELYESGRWRRYHTEQAFVDNIRDAKRAVEAWRLLAPPSEECEGDTAAARWLSRQPLMIAVPPATRSSDRQTASLLPPPRLPDRVGSNHHLRKP